MQHKSPYNWLIIKLSRAFSLLFLAVCILYGGSEASAREGYHIGITPVILADRTSFLIDWQTYLTQRLNQPVEFIQRQTYREIVDLLLESDLDAAWLCGYPYVRHRSELKLLSVPLFRGKQTYHSYLIVPSTDTKTQNILDLKNKVFAYSDPDSNSGYLYPRINLINRGIEPKHYFRKTFFTWSHRAVVKAVADGVAQGGAVDSYVWETLAEKEPELTRRTRVVSKSPEYGFPPMVIRRDLTQQRADYLRNALIDMSSDEAGTSLLRQLNLDGFVLGNDELYNGISESIRILEGGL
jgi:phosphonate transport system substrate-binding protein